MIYLNNGIILSQLMKFESKTLYINITEIKTIVFIRTLAAMPCLPPYDQVNNK